MAVMPNSRTDWRWRIAHDPGTAPSQIWLLTDPQYNLIAGHDEFPAFFATAFLRRYTDRGFVQAPSQPLVAEATGVPFRPLDYPNPRAYQRSLDLRTWIQTRRPIYDAQEVEPFYQTNWPNPRGYPFPLSNRGFVAGTPLLLRMSPFVQTDWPNPRGYPFPLSDRGFAAGTPLLLTMSPFFQTEWPLPGRFAFDKKLPIANRGFVKGWGALYLDIRWDPFNQLDWPVPKGRPYPISLRFLGPQSFLYIFEQAGYGDIMDMYADGGSLFDMLANGGDLADEYANGGALFDSFSDGGDLSDEYSNGGWLSDG